MRPNSLKCLLMAAGVALSCSPLFAQYSLKPKYKNSSIYAGIEVGSKGVKMSIVEIGRNARKSGAFNILKDTSVNTDFISFKSETTEATLSGFAGLYDMAINKFNIPSSRIHTVISSGVKTQSEKDKKQDMVKALIDSFRLKINEPARIVEVVDVLQEARLSHLGIVPDDKRYNTFLVDIGSGNTKGGFFPYGNTTDFKLFELTWGTKSTANETEKRCDELDKSLANYNRQLNRVLTGIEQKEIIFAVNSSGAYPLSDNIGFSGGIAWSVAVLAHPELIDQSIVPVTFEEIQKLSEKMFRNYTSLAAPALIRSLADKNLDKQTLAAITKEIKTVHGVFDQRSLMAGTGLLLKMMRQFASVYETKQFYLVKNGHVGWISAYVNQHK